MTHWGRFDKEPLIVSTHGQAVELLIFLVLQCLLLKKIHLWQYGLNEPINQRFIQNLSLDHLVSLYPLMNMIKDVHGFIIPKKVSRLFPISQ